MSFYINESSGMAHYHNNLSFPVLGPVTVHYSDGSTVTHTITGIGTTTFDTGSLQPVSIDLLGNNYSIADMPLSVCYPDNSTGTLGCNGAGGSEVVIYNDIYRPIRPYGC